MYCRIVDEKAVDVVPTYKDRFHEGLHSQFVECPNDVQAGWVYNADEDTWSAPPEIEEEEEESSE
tara:strand:+ start:1111 stop:1305 length:195 start_codon:yes stop_codon:yes gene_type:complete